MQFEPRPFGKYFLTDRIAVGGMAEIYKAKTFGVDGFEKTLAIKKILSNYSADKDFVTMLTDEAKLVVQLSHPNIVQVYDLGRVGDDYFLSMECIDGVNLREIVARGQELNAELPVEICLYVAAEIAKGLDYAHAKRGADGRPLGIVHRDVSPHNVLVSFEGEVKLVDFGIAKAAMNAAQTLMGTLKGKVTYMSPEQALGRPLDNRTDIFSLGIVLYEILTAERLFTGDSQMEVLKTIRETRITEDRLRGRVPAGTEAILARALAYNPRDRYPSAADMQVELTRLLYSRHRDFAPRLLASLLKTWYGIPASPAPTSAVESSLKSLSLGRDEPSLIPVRDSALLPETLRAGEVKPEDFRAAPSSNAADGEEATEKASVAATVREGPFVRMRRSWGRMVLAAAILPALVAGYFAVETLRHGTRTPRTGIANVRLNSRPSGADIYLDGADTGLKTPALLRRLSLGQEYEITLVKDGFESLTTRLLPESPRPLPLDFTLTRPDQAGQFALTVRSDPPGAAIELDGRGTGRTTPSEFKGLRPGREYGVTLRLTGYREHRSAVQNDATRDQIVDVRLVKADAAEVAIDSDPPGAVIVLNGRDTSFTTPHVFGDLSVPQVVEFRFRMPGFEEGVETVGLTAPGRKSLRVRLRKSGGNDGAEKTGGDAPAVRTGGENPRQRLSKLLRYKTER